jgi:hypothetical protein
MSEKIKLYPVMATHTNPKTGETRIKPARAVESVAKGDIPNSLGLEPKAVHKIKVKRGEKETEVSMVARDVGPRGVDEYAKTWRAFRKAGIPVVEHMWKSEDGKVFVKDLKRDGSEIFGKAYGMLTSIKSERQKLALTPMEEKFIKIIETDLPKIRSAAEEMAKRATQCGLVLPWDDAFELLVHPDGTWQIIVLDLRTAKINQDAWQNNRYVWGEIEGLVKLKDFLLAKTRPEVEQ